MLPLPWSSEENVYKLATRLPPGFLRTYVGWACNQTDAPLWSHVGTGLAILSAVIPSHMNLGGDLPESGMYGNLYTMIVGRQGRDRKSTALRRGWNLLKEAVPERRGDEPGSPQGLVQGLADRPQQILIYEDLADLFLMTQRRAGGNQMTGIKAKLLRAFDCDPVSYRLKRSLIRVDNPRLSIFGGVNRPILDIYVDIEDWTNGLMSRFFVCFGSRERQLYRRQNDPPTRRWLVDWLGAAATYADDEGAWGPCVGVDPQSEYMLACFEHALDVTAPVRGDRTDGPRARTRTMAVKIALLSAFSSGYGWPQGQGVPGRPWVIPADITQDAIQFALMSFAGALAITHTTTGSRDMQDRTAVLESIRETWTPLSEILVNARLLERRATPVLLSLATEGTIEVQVTSRSRDYRLTGLNQRASGVAEASRDIATIVDVYTKTLTTGLPAGSGGLLPPINGVRPVIPTWIPNPSPATPALTTNDGGPSGDATDEYEDGHLWNLSDDSFN